MLSFTDIKQKWNKKKLEWRYKKIMQTIDADQQLSSLATLDNIKAIVQSRFETEKFAVIYREIANFLLNSGQPDFAKKYFLHSLAAARTPHTYSLYLQCLLMSPTCTEKNMLIESKKYNKFFLSKIKQYQHTKHHLDPNKKLTIGYVCHFFNNAPSQTLLLPYLKQHNREQFTIVCYSDALADEIPSDIRNIPDRWRDTEALNDQSLAELIRTDEVDILLELNGHCIINRYGAIARRPAPIQVSHYNWSATSGVAAIDYILVGEEFRLNQANYSEKIYYHKGVRKALAFPDYFPPCAPPPCFKNQYVTFGSFGAAHKINGQVINVWCKILRQVPNARFYMKASVLDHAPFIKAYEQLFAAQGCDLNNIYFEGYTTHEKMLQAYEKVDIALDSFPYSGATSVREALWQGVPVVSLCNETKHCLQHGKAILRSMGHAELVANSVAEYVSIAVTLAKKKSLLLEYRNTLRQDFKTSPLLDLNNWIKHLEEAYREMWKRYCSA